MKIAADKWKHFFVGIPMGAIIQAFALYFFYRQFFTSILLTFVSVVAICYGFELFSLITKKGHYEILDALAGTIVGLIGMIVILLFKL